MITERKVQCRVESLEYRNQRPAQKTRSGGSGELWLCELEGVGLDGRLESSIARDKGLRHRYSRSIAARRRRPRGLLLLRAVRSGRARCGSGSSRRDASRQCDETRARGDVELVPLRLAQHVRDRVLQNLLRVEQQLPRPILRVVEHTHLASTVYEYSMFET